MKLLLSSVNMELNISLISTDSSVTILNNDQKDLVRSFITDSRVTDPILEKSLTLIWIFFIALGLISNLILIIVIAVSPNLHSPNALLLCNLFIADVIYTLFSMPFTLTTILHRSWTLGKLLCKAVPFLQTNTAFVTAGTVTAIAIDRQYRILGNSTSGHRINFYRPSYGKRISLLIWLISIAFSSPLLYFQRLDTLFHYEELSLDICHETQELYRFRMIYHSLVYGFFIFVPTITLAFSYFRIRSHLKYNGIDKRRQTYLLSNSAMNESQISSLMKRFDFLRKEIDANTKVTLVLFMGIIIYVINWLPLCIFNLLMDLSLSSKTISASMITIATIIFHVFAISSATTNAFIYGYLNTNIQKELHHLLTKLSSLSCFS